MNDTDKPGDDQSRAPVPPSGEPMKASDAAPAEPAEAADSGEVSGLQLREIIGVLQADLDAVRTEKLRLLADMDNLRKRADREKADTAKYAVTKFAHDVVGVVDNFERAASTVPADAAEKDPVLKSFLGGVLLAEREFLAVLERHGVRRVEAENQPFDPHRHQAVMERDDPGVPNGTVLQVFQAGFMIEDRCLRPAMVVVSRGGPKPGAVPAAAPVQPEAAATPLPADAPPGDPPQTN
ncbi:MAG: nucleotide exchange factor GrpE [Hyphomicrobium sp.]